MRKFVLRKLIHFVGVRGWVFAERSALEKFAPKNVITELDK